MYFCNFLTWLITVFSIIIVVVENTNWFLWFCQLYPKFERMQATIVIPFSHILIRKMTKYLSVFSQHIVAFLEDALPIQNINILNFVKDFSNICVIKMILTSSTDLYISTTVRLWIIMLPISEIILWLNNLIRIIGSLSFIPIVFSIKVYIYRK